MSRPVVFNARKVGKHRSGAVYVGRPSPYKNHYVIGKDGTREEVIAKYIAWLHKNPDFVERIRRELAGKDLICWCAPEACHGHIQRDIAAGDPVPPIPQEDQLQLI